MGTNLSGMRGMNTVPVTSSSCSLRDFNSWRVPSYAERLLLPTSCTEIAQQVRRYGQKIHIIGYGSNTLMPSDKIMDVVMVLKKNFSNIQEIGSSSIIVEAGCAAPKLARWAADRGFNNLNFLVGIPGSVGGSAMMNAGAHQRAIMEEVLWLEVIDSQGAIHQLRPADYSYQYRKLLLPFAGIVSRVALQLRDDPQAWSIKDVLAYRAKTQPLGLWTCGSVFKNPKGYLSAGWLIEQVGLKGFRYGDLQISLKHANFIVNHENATAPQILKLTRWIQERVYALTGAVLEPEYQCLAPIFNRL